MVFQYIASGLGTNRISYKIFDTHHVSKVAAHVHKKAKCSYIHSNIQSKKVDKY